MSNNGAKLSKESKAFLENLRVYLFSSGKNSEETEVIIEELAVHLMEAEKAGKPIDKVIGQSPKEYMESLSSEMPVDYSAWFKYIPIIVFGAFSFSIIDDLLQGELAYSLIEIVGHLLISLLFIGAVFNVFKYVSANTISLKMQAVLFFILGLSPIALFVGLIYLNRAIETPIIYFGLIGSIIIAIITLTFLIGISVWAKSWIVIIIITLLNLPDYLLGLSTLQENTQLILSTFISFGGIAVYLLITTLMEKSKQSDV